MMHDMNDSDTKVSECAAERIVSRHVEPVCALAYERARE